MEKIVLCLPKRVKLEFRRWRRWTKDKGLALRIQIVLLAAKGRDSRVIAEAVGYHRSWVSRVLQRFRAEGSAGLMDRREDNGQAKLNEEYLGQLHELVSRGPPDYGYLRPTWTRELLVEVLAERTGIRVHVATMSRALQAIGRGAGGPGQWCGAHGRKPRKPSGFAPCAGCWRNCRRGRWRCTRTRWTFT